MANKRQQNVRQRGKRFVASGRVNGQQYWKSFRTRDEAELHAAQQLIWSEVCQVARLEGPRLRAFLFGGGSAAAVVDVVSRLICAGRDRRTGCAS